MDFTPESSMVKQREYDDVIDNDAYTPLGSISAHEVMNSPRWWEPRMEESLLNNVLVSF